MATSRRGLIANIAMAAYCVICFGALLAPMALMGVFPGSVNTETEATVSDSPDEESSRSVRELADSFEKGFGLRRQLIWLDAQMRETVFGESSNSRVTIGKDGWLFLSETLDASSEANAADDALIWRTARTLALANEYLVGSGTSFFVAVAPNKAQIYEEYLPYYASVPRDATGRTSLDRLHEALDLVGVPYADLLGELKSAKGNTDIYHKLDTHWNNLGAMAAYRAIAARAGSLIAIDGGEFDYDAYENLNATVSKSWRGDLMNMLDPGSENLDDQYDFAIERAFSSRRPIANLDDMEIVTRSRKNGIRAMFFRDSFANAQLTLLSNNIGEATYLRALPFAFWRAASEGCDIAVLTVVERNIFEVASRPPVIPAPARAGMANVISNAKNMSSSDGKVVARWESAGGYDKLSGYYDPALTDGGAARVYVVFTKADESFDAARGIVYEAFPTLDADARAEAVDAFGSAVGASGFIMYANAKEQGFDADEYDARLLIVPEGAGEALFTSEAFAGRS